MKILNWALKYRTGVANLFIFSENMKEEKEVVSIVEALTERGTYNIVFQELGSNVVSHRYPPWYWENL